MPTSGLFRSATSKCASRAVFTTIGRPEEFLEPDLSETSVISRLVYFVQRQLNIQHGQFSGLSDVLFRSRNKSGDSKMICTTAATPEQRIFRDKSVIFSPRAFPTRHSLFLDELQREQRRANTHPYVHRRSYISSYYGH